MNHLPPTLRSARRRLRERLSLVAVAAVALAATPFVARLRPAVAPVELTRAAEELAGLPSGAATLVAEHARAVSEGTGSFLGFDTHSYPGDRAMARWRAASKYEWVGFYLPAPCHRETSWSGKRTTLARQGWGMAVIYVGQQTWAHSPRLTAKQRARAKAGGATCLPEFVSGARGRTEGEDAVQRTAAEGFAPGTVIYLDIERMDVVPKRMRDYYRQWVDAVLADGRYVPGVYVHTYNAELVHRDFRAVYAAHGVRAEPPSWVAGGRGFDRRDEPREVGHTFAHAWQGVLDIVETRGGVRLPIDVNVAAVKSPSGLVAMAE